MIGLSLSLCVAHMARGHVDPEKVEKIIAGTKLETLEQWDNAIQRYRETYWHENPDLAEKLVREFLASGKILQPRISENRAPWIGPDCTIFVDSEDQIRYYEC